MSGICMWHTCTYRHICTDFGVQICLYLPVLWEIYAHFHDLSLYLPVFKQIYAHFHDLCNHIQAHMHFSGSSYLPVFACIFVCICLYLPISVSLMRRQRALDSIVILSRSRSRRGIHSRRRARPPRRRRRGSNFKSNRIKRHTPRRRDALFKQSEPRSGRRWRPERGVGVRRTFSILLVLELALDDLGLGATALGCDYILTSSNQHHFVRSYSPHDNANENSECS